ncbi:MAG: prolipoprotein diacylglyceryl transferase family protein [Anaerolineales bacterium]
MVAFYLPGEVPVYAFSLLLGAAASLGLFWVAWQSEPQLARQRVVAGLGTLLGGLLGGRAAYIGVNWAYFQNHPAEIIQLPLGGLAWPGAVAGGILALPIVALIGRQSLPGLADALLPLIAVLTIAVWLACWMDGCAYGQPTGAWYSVPARDEWGNLTGRWPLQFTGALITFALVQGIDHARNRGWLQIPGRAACVGVFGLSLQWWLLSLLRADPAPQWNGQRLDTWAAIGFAILAALALLVMLIRPQLCD